MEVSVMDVCAAATVGHIQISAIAQQTGIAEGAGTTPRVYKTDPITPAEMLQALEREAAGDRPSQTGAGAGYERH